MPNTIKPKRATRRKGIEKRSRCNMPSEYLKCRLVWERKLPKTGPKITPELIAIPDQAIILLLCFIEVISLRYALLTGITADVNIPPRIRAI